jgi:hypothetical protein
MESTFSTKLGDLFGSEYSEHIKAGEEYWYNFGGLRITDDTVIYWCKIKVTYIRSGVMFYIFDGYPEAGERHADLNSMMTELMEIAILDPVKDLGIPEESSYRFDDTHTKIVNWNNNGEGSQNPIDSVINSAIEVIKNKK